jgi:hypothetical protein
VSNDRWELRNTAAVGVSTFGKTTFILRYLVADQRLAVRFIFDPLGKMANTLGLTSAETWEECEMAIDDGFVCFDPTALFPGDKKPAVEAFAAWAYRRSQELPGRKALLVDEVWRYQSAQSIPQPLAEWIQDGAKWGMETAFATQVPNKLNSSITANLSEVVCFRLQERNALDVVESLGFDRAEVSRLPQGHFVSMNLFSGALIRARLW